MPGLSENWSFGFGFSQCWWPGLILVGYSMKDGVWCVALGDGSWHLETEGCPEPLVMWKTAGQSSKTREKGAMKPGVKEESFVYSDINSTNVCWSNPVEQINHWPVKNFLTTWDILGTMRNTSGAIWLLSKMCHEIVWLLLEGPRKQ